VLEDTEPPPEALPNAELITATAPAINTGSNARPTGPNDSANLVPCFIPLDIDSALSVAMFDAAAALFAADC